MSQEVIVAGKTYRRNHPVVKLLNHLHYLEVGLYSLPVKWGDYYPREIAQQLVVGVIKAIFDTNPKQYDILLTEISEKITSECEVISTVKIEDELLATEQNWEVYRTWALCEQALNGCVEAKDYLELEAKDTSYNMLWALEKSSNALSALLDWLYKFVIVHSLNEEGKLASKYKQWDQEKINTLNL